MEEFPSCCNSENRWFQQRIIIIGAGISGLACGSRLKDLGFTNVNILEARNRVGGRIYTIDLGANFIEMGAQWIHGQEDNIIYRIADSNKLIDKNAFNYLDALRSFENLSENERNSLCVLFNFLDDKLYNISDHPFSSYSLLSYLDQHFKNYVSQFPPTESLDRVHEGYEWFCKFHCEINGCKSLSDVSLNLYNKYKECDGNLALELKNGYSSILKLLLKTIPSDWIQENKQVVSVDWSAFENEFIPGNEIYNPISSTNLKSCRSVKVTCADGETYLADHVIVTIPLGCLKKYGQSIFVPPLNKKKMTAVGCIGFGIVNKVYLDFEQPFWETPIIYNVLWNKSFEEKFLKEDKHKDPSELWVKYINRFAYSPRHPNMLCAWVVSEGAVIMESLSEEEVLSDCMKLLGMLLGEKLPWPKGIFRSSWLSDSFACGSYSYFSVECEKEDVSFQDIAEPEYSNTPCFKHPVLMFAGEATHEYYFSTVHGAYETGIREAERIFQHYGIRSYEVLSAEWEATTHRLAKLMSNKDSLCNNLNVVVVGGGIAGLASALHLAKNKFYKITILEAQDRVGGRVCTVKYNDSFLELGAQWIHGTDNALYEFSKAKELLPHVLDKSSFEGKGTFCTSDGDVIDASLVEEVKEILNDAKIQLEKGRYNAKASQSVMSFFQRLLIHI